MLVCASALVLSACGTQTVSVPAVNGTPSINISVPLSSVACTTSNSCVALGTSQSGGTPASAGEVRVANGRWIVIGVPGVTSGYVTGAACGRTQCLFVGAQPTGDLVWRYDATDRTVSAMTAPTTGTSVSAVSCVANLSCMMADATPAGPRLLTTTDGAATWTAQSTPTTSAGDQIAHLACVTALHCMAITQLSAGGVDISLTSDGGVTWTSTGTETAPNVTSVSSLSCIVRQCTMVYVTGSGTTVARSTDFGVRWSDFSGVGATASLVACTSAKHCVFAGRSDGSTPWIETTVGRHVAKVELHYVPSPFEALACGSSVCAGVGATTVVSVRP
jgi:hypothetical protein